MVRSHFGRVCCLVKPSLVMAGWQIRLQSMICHVGRRLENNYHTSSNQFCLARSSLLVGDSCHLQGPWKSPSANISNPLFNYLQQLGISSSRNLQADSSALTPVPSLLTPGLASNDNTDGTTDKRKDVAKPATVQAVLKGIKQSPKKVNLVAALVRGMRVEDALLQLQLTVKRASKAVYQVIHSARANATHNHGLDPDRLLVAEAFTGKGYFKKRVSYHAKGKCGVKERPECRLTVVLREITAVEEAEIAKLRVSNFRKLSKRERRLVPHKLIESTPIWDRKGKGSNQCSVMDA